MAGWYHEKAWKQLVSTAISYSSAFTPEEQFSKAGICAPWRLWLGGYSYQHWTFSSGLMRQAGPVEAPTVNRTNAILSSNGLQVLHELGGSTRAFWCAAALLSDCSANKAYTVSWQFRCEKKHIDTQSCSPQRWRCDYHHALPWVVYTQGAVSASAACAPLPKKTQTTTYENKIIKEAGTHW